MFSLRVKQGKLFLPAKLPPEQTNTVAKQSCGGWIELHVIMFIFKSRYFPLAYENAQTSLFSPKHV